MSLLDIDFTDYSTPQYYVEPLIDPALENTDIIDDLVVFKLEGNVTKERWRQFIDIEKWNPKEHHDKLLNRRNYHIRNCWECIVLISYSEAHWLIRPALEQIRNISSLELRITEIEIISYQITCGMLGIQGDHKQLMRTGWTCYLANMFIAEYIIGNDIKKMTKSQNKCYYDLFHTKPMSCDSKKELALKIDEYVLGLHVFLKNIKRVVGLKDDDDNTKKILEISMQIKKCIVSLDEILFVV